MYLKFFEITNGIKEDLKTDLDFYQLVPVSKYFVVPPFE